MHYVDYLNTQLYFLYVGTQSLFAKYCATDKRTQPDIQKKVA